MSKELLELLTYDGVIGFLAPHTGLSLNRVARIYRLGEPWPLVGSEACKLGLRAVQLGVDQFKFIAPLRDISIDDTGEKISSLLAALEQGKVPAAIPELEHAKISKSLEKIAALAGEQTDTVWLVYRGVLAYLRRVGELIEQPLQGAEKDRA